MLMVASIFLHCDIADRTVELTKKALVGPFLRMKVKVGMQDAGIQTSDSLTVICNR